MQNPFIIFDCDGVLIDSEIISARMLREEALVWGVDISIAHILENYVGRSYPTVLAQIQEQFQIELPDDFGQAYRSRLLLAFERELRPIDGVKDMLLTLEFPYCVATSSSPERVARSLSMTGLWDHFEGRIFTASQVSRGKPAPDLFLLAAGASGASVENCIVVEDSKMGIQAGLAAGMKTIRFTGGSHITQKHDAAGSQLTFDNFDHFIEIVESL